MTGFKPLTFRLLTLQNIVARINLPSRTNPRRMRFDALE